MSSTIKITPHRSREVAKVRRYVWIGALLWSALLTGFYVSTTVEVDREAKDMARLTAAAAFEKDVLLRRWAAQHGGVYVTVDDKTPPNPYLAGVPERDIVTPSGRRLTLLNPTYMNRQIYEMSRGVAGAPQERLTSLKPLRPENAPDPWEAQALKALQKGAHEVAERVTLGGEPVLRFMRPLMVEKPCLGCHAVQGYREGELRGGIGIAVPMQPFLLAAAAELDRQAVMHVLIWLFGMGVLWLGGSKIVQGIRRSEAEHAQLAESEQRFRALSEGTLSGIAILLDGAIVECNQALAGLYGYGEEEMIGMRAPALLVPAAAALASGAPDGDQPLTFEATAQRKDGSVFTVAVRCVGIHYQGREARIAEIRDIGAQRAAEQNLRLAASVFTGAREGIVIATADGTIVDVNEAFTHITGYSRDEVLGRNPRLLKSERQTPAFYTKLWSELQEKGHWYGEIWNRRKNGEIFPEMLTISAVRDGRGETMHYIALFSDISAIKEQERRLEQIAHYDALTGLPNRVLLADRLAQAMGRARRQGSRLAVGFIDLDGFKAINDRHGHEVGDQLLMSVAVRMRQALREGDTLARFGGDEFVALLLDLPEEEACTPILARMLAAAAESIHIGERRLEISASIGVTFFPQSEEVDGDHLLRQADQAMYQAKVAGRNRCHIFDTEADRGVRGRVEGLERIRAALEQRAFVLYYQPKVNMRLGTIVGAEALIRWLHPQRGLLLPAEFLPEIEDHPLEVELGEWVLDSALAQIEQWRAAGLDIPVSVNIGAFPLQQPDFAARLGAILARHPAVEPGRLVLEVLETSALRDLAVASEVMRECNRLGVSFALDDFGTGYSSLTYFKRLPVTQLKIDKSFVRDMLDDPDDLSILDGVIGLASAFRREVIAEGVETAEHGKMLLLLGCELAQGFGIARPMPAHEMPAWAASWRGERAWGGLRPVARDDLPLLFAGAESHAWVMAIEEYLQGVRDCPPGADLLRGRFEPWLEAAGAARHASEPAFQVLHSLQRRLRRDGQELCELKGAGLPAKACARVEQLHGLRRAMLTQASLLVEHWQLRRAQEERPAPCEAGLRDSYLSS